MKDCQAVRRVDAKKREFPLFFDIFSRIRAWLERAFLGKSLLSEAAAAAPAASAAAAPAALTRSLIIPGVLV